MPCYYCGHDEAEHKDGQCRHDNWDLDSRSVAYCTCVAMVPVCEHDTIRKKVFENIYYCVKCDVAMNVRAVEPAQVITEEQWENLRRIIKEQMDEELDAMLTPQGRAAVAQVRERKRGEAKCL